MEMEEIKEIMSLLEESSLNKIKVKKGDFELLLEKNPSTKFSSLPLQSTTAVSSEKMQCADALVEDEKCSFIKSPMVGTFYASPAPDNPAFVKPGDRVSEDTVVCIIEAMKVMNEVKAGMNGVVKEILQQSSGPVEFGTKLFKIELL